MGTINDLHPISLVHHSRCTSGFQQRIVYQLRIQHTASQSGGTAIHIADIALSAQPVHDYRTHRIRLQFSCISGSLPLSSRVHIRPCVQLRLRIVVKAGHEIISNLIKTSAHNRKRRFDTDKEFMMMFHQIIDVLLAVKTTIHDQLEFFKIKEINIFDEIFNHLYIRDVSCKFSVVYRKPRLLAIKQSEVNLWKRITFFVLPILDLFYQ